MQKKLKTFGLAIVAFTLAFAAQASDGLSVYLVSGASPQKTKLEDIQKITFAANGDLQLKPFTGSSVVYTFSNIKKVIFEGMTVNDAINPLAPDLKLYVSPQGELSVESATDIKSLTVFSIGGNVLDKTASSKMDIGSLPQGVYILKIDTGEGTVVKKFINQ